MVKFNYSTLNSIVIEIPFEHLRQFIANLEKKIVADFGVSDSSTVFNFFIEEPYKQGNVKEKLESLAESEPFEADPTVSKANEFMSKLLDEVPFKYSNELSDYLRETAKVVPMLQKMNALNSFWTQSLLVSIDDGYGMTDFLRSLGLFYSALGIATENSGKLQEPKEIYIRIYPEGQNIYADWDNVIDLAQGMKDKNEKTPGSHPILCLDISEWQYKLMSDELKPYLRKLNACSGNFTLVFKIPFVEARAINAVGEALSDIFSIHSIVVPPTPLKHLIEYAKEQLAKRNFSLAEDADNNIEKMILQEKRDASFFGFKTVDKIVDRIIYEKAKENCRIGKVDRNLSKSDIASSMFEINQSESDPDEEIKELVGLEPVKQRISEIIAKIKTHKRLSDNKKITLERPAIHMMFTGNPGTGKTTVARLVAQLFHKEGILSKGYLIEVKGRDLCGKYIGHTAPLTSAICRDAYGSVLFIDEAYSLFNDSTFKNDFGLEALATLIAEMENHRDDMCVIMAGYSDEMRTMLRGNPGLESRIPYHVDFPNYSREELIKIFFMMTDANGFKYEPAFKEAVSDFFNHIPDNKISAKGFSNARFVRNLFERTWGKAACRGCLDEEEIVLLASDLIGASEENEFKQLIENTSRKSIGFGS